MSRRRPLNAGIVDSLRTAPDIRIADGWSLRSGLALEYLVFQMIEVAEHLGVVRIIDGEENANRAARLGSARFADVSAGPGAGGSER